jgi:hypothetical protein
VCPSTSPTEAQQSLALATHPPADGDAFLVAPAEAQGKADTYLACIADVADDDREQHDACAQAADVEYKTFDELSQEEEP